MTAGIPATRAAQVKAAWEIGELSWKLDPNQIGMYEAFFGNWHRAIKHVLNCSRQLGKSYWACVVAIEYALKNPGASIKYAAQTAKQVRKIIRPHFRAILGDCPKELRPKFHSQDGEYRFPNGSTITVGGCDRENAETLRGQHAHLVIIDEAGAIDDLRYVVDDILMPQTITTGGRILIISTPAKTPGHPYKEFCDAAEADGVLIERTIYDNPRIPKDRIEALKRESGGEESTTWAREYLVRHVTDEESAVIAEATRERMTATIIPLQHPDDISYRPEFFDTYVVMDLGWSPDFTGILWAIWDFERQELVIEHEFIMRRANTDTIATVLRTVTDELWGTNHRPYMCISDIDYRLISDLGNRGWNFLPADKDNKDAAIAQVRQAVTRSKYGFRSHPRCKAWRRQMQNATWNKQRTRFDRTEKDGHFDLVDCTIYLRRHAHVHRNPEPLDRGPVAHRRFQLPVEQPKSATQRALERVFGRK